MQHLLLHYGEIALKQKNRGLFERALVDHIHRKCSKIGPCQVRKLPGRISLEFAAPVDEKTVTERLQKIGGVVNFIPCTVTPPSLDKLRESLGLALLERNWKSFAVRAKRADKNFPVGSQFVNETIGAFVVEKTGAKVDLTNPETTIWIECLSDRILYGFEKIRGMGGMPCETAGRVAGLLSGGIDSPVALWRMIRRGCGVDFIHFHSTPLTNEAAVEKALDLAEMLNDFQSSAKFFSVPFGEIQRKIIAATSEPYRVLLYRRLMFRIAEKIAREHRLQGLVTGESLAQVASQTLENLAAIESVVSIPVYRPLVGMDKEEIVAQARRIGTFEKSTEPHDDCCSFMTPKRPKTKARIRELDEEEKRLDIDGLVVKGVKETQIIQL